MSGFSLTRLIKILLFLFLLIAGLVYARPFLVPLTFAAIMAMLFLPLCSWLEARGVHKVIAILLCIIIMLCSIAGVLWLLYWQVTDLAENAGKIQENFMKRLDQVRRFISSSIGISKQKQEELIQNGQSSETIGHTVSGILSGLGELLTDFILFVVYLFMLLYYRLFLKRFVLMWVPQKDREKTSAIIENCRHVAQQYLGGLIIMIGCLWVMYSIGFALVGVKSPIFFAILCGLLEIVPFVGNLTGNAITMLMVIAQGGNFSMILGILLTYGAIQFIQTYLLEPLVVGAEVNINPLITIISLVLGELIWGIPGMVLAIPVMGIIKIVCDNIEELRPFGFLLGRERTERKTHFADRLRKWRMRREVMLDDR
ncbi:AI-2E family transporter [Chitinophagaceae bacterium LB-8]|uniref:AI-2E family transporter n=1 Tax=Paraflavisolibacter caeni TaxID=2982496 RepID=A0A9X3BIG7_9BACT|nr:AI-2E family transporter [Paraflavisolibacter caeni]MCU7551317.1 AI-2E family transporter [Paraflavisolibacter caeni]